MEEIVSPLRMEVVISSKSGALGLYVRNFMVDRGIPVKLRFAGSERGKDIRALFSEKDDLKVYPILVVTQNEKVILTYEKPGVAKLYELYHAYLNKDEQR
jgi:hypothetical protein